MSLEHEKGGSAIENQTRSKLNKQNSFIFCVHLIIRWMQGATSWCWKSEKGNSHVDTRSKWEKVHGKNLNRFPIIICSPYRLSVGWPGDGVVYFQSNDVGCVNHIVLLFHKFNRFNFNVFISFKTTRFSIWFSFSPLFLSIQFFCCLGLHFYWKMYHTAMLRT